MGAFEKVLASLDQDEEFHEVVAQIVSAIENLTRERPRASLDTLATSHEVTEMFRRIPKTNELQLVQNLIAKHIATHPELGLHLITLHRSYDPGSAERILDLAENAIVDLATNPSLSQCFEFDLTREQDLANGAHSKLLAKAKIVIDLLERFSTHPQAARAFCETESFGLFSDQVRNDGDFLTKLVCAVNLGDQDFARLTLAFNGVRQFRDRTTSQIASPLSRG